MQATEKLSAAEVKKIQALYKQFGGRATAMLSDRQAKLVNESLGRATGPFHGLCR